MEMSFRLTVLSFPYRALTPIPKWLVPDARNIVHSFHAGVPCVGMLRRSTTGRLRLRTAAGFDHDEIAFATALQTSYSLKRAEHHPV